MQPELIKLPNGQQVCLINLPGNTASSTQIWFRAGSSLEVEKDYGIAHFLEHMFFKGTAKRPGHMVAHEVESFGGEINAFTSFDYTCYYINSPSRHVTTSLEILLDMVSNPLFTNDEIPSEREVVLEEFKRSQDRASQVNFQKIQETFFEGGYKHAILGNPGTISSFTQEQIKNFRALKYNKSNTLILVAGDLSKEETKNRVLSLCSEYVIPEGEENTFEELKLKSKPATTVHTGNTKMNQLTLVISADDQHELNGIAEELALNVLASGETSYLYKALVLDGGHANSTSASSLFMNKKGAHFLSINCPPQNTDIVIKKFQELLLFVIENGLDKEHIEKIRGQFLASKIYERESIESFSFSIGQSFAQANDITFENQILEKIKTIPAKLIEESLINLLQKTIHVALQVPKEEKTTKWTKSIAALSKKLNSLPITKKKNYKSILTLKEDPSFELIEIKKGINLLYRYNPMAPTFVAHLYLQGGLTLETKATNGIFNLMTSNLMKGSPLKSADELRMIFESYSATCSPFSGKNAYGATLHGQSAHFEELVPLVLSCIINPLFPEKEIKLEKSLILRALQNQKAEPTKHLFHLFHEMNFTKHPYAMNPLGTDKNIKKFKRSDLLKVHRNQLNKSPILFTVIGNLPKDQVIALAQKEFAHLKERAFSKMPRKKIISEKNKAKFLKFDREQSHLFIGQPTQPMDHQENIILKMFSTYLSGQSSPLFVEVRDKKGLCYSVAPLHMSALEGGYFGIYIGTGHEKRDDALKTIKELLEHYQNSGLSNEDFDRIKQMIQGQNELTLQTNEDYANLYGISTFQGLGSNFFHLTQKIIQDMKYEEFQSTLKKILARSWNTVIVGR